MEFDTEKFFRPLAENESTTPPAAALTSEPPVLRNRGNDEVQKRLDKSFTLFVKGKE
jgi:hypothetical protein